MRISNDICVRIRYSHLQYSIHDFIRRIPGWIIVVYCNDTKIHTSRESQFVISICFHCVFARKQVSIADKWVHLNFHTIYSFKSTINDGKPFNINECIFTWCCGYYQLTTKCKRMLYFLHRSAKWNKYCIISSWCRLWIVDTVLATTDAFRASQCLK